MKVITKAVVLAVAAFSLAACNDESKTPAKIGVSAESAQGVEFKESSSLQRDKRLEVKSGETVGVTMPAYTLVSEVLRELAYEHKAGRANEVRFGMLKQRPEKLFTNSDGSFSADDKNRDIALAMIATAVAPAYGWPVNIQSSSVKDRADTSNYVAMQGTSVVFADKVALDLAKRVGAATLKDADAARNEIRKAWNDLATQEIVMLWGDSAHEVERAMRDGWIVEESGDMQWTVGGYSFKGSQNGFAMAVYGAPRFGDGIIGGQKIELAMESSRSTTMTKGKSLGTDESSTNSTSKKSAVSLGQ